MPFQPTVIGQLMKSLPRRAFEAAVEGRAKWGLSDWAHLVTLVMAQIAGVRSLRDLERLVAHHRGALSHLAVSGVRCSTLADANQTRSTVPFEAVAAHISGLIARHAPGLSREALRLVDATRIHAGQAVRDWAVDGALKLHVMLDPILQRTVCFAVTPARVNDITPAKLFPIEAGLTYVFDRGYYDFGFWARLHAAGCRFVTRLKKNTPISNARLRRVPRQATHVLSDSVGWLPMRLCHSRRNPFSAKVRVITVEISSGRIIELVNDLKTPAVEIARLYKARWDIELFFKWIKQNLKIQHFLGTSRNAVTLQIIAALIGFLLVRLSRNSSPVPASPFKRPFASSTPCCCNVGPFTICFTRYHRPQTPQANMLNSLSPSHDLFRTAVATTPKPPMTDAGCVVRLKWSVTMNNFWRTLWLMCTAGGLEDPTQNFDFKPVMRRVRIITGPDDLPIPANDNEPEARANER